MCKKECLLLFDIIFIRKKKYRKEGLILRDIMFRTLFRGKRTDNREWVEGFYSQLPKPSLGAAIIANGDLCAEDMSSGSLNDRIKC